MPQESRIERIMSGLTAMERSKLVLDSYRFDTREDLLIRRMMPQRHRAAFNEAIYRMNAANMYIAQTINLLEADLDLLWSRWLLLHYVTEWQYNLMEIEEALQQPGHSNGPRGARGAQRAAQTTERPCFCGGFLRLRVVPEAEVLVVLGRGQAAPTGFLDV